MRHLVIHPQNPQIRHLQQAADIVRQGGIVIFPTDACYVFGCRLGDKDALDRIRAIRQIDEKHHLTLMVRDLSEIAHFAKVDNRQYRLLKSATPGAYVFILEGTKELPRRVLHPKRKTIGLRVPDSVAAQGLLSALNEPLLTTTVFLSGDEFPLAEGTEIADRLGDQVDVLLDAGHCGTAPCSIINLCDDEVEILREGKGNTGIFKELAA